MSQALFKHGGLRFWNEEEIDIRNEFIDRCSHIVRQKLRGVNSAWQFHRCEGPILHPRQELSSEYTDDDLFVTNHKDFVLRAETTPSSYAYAKSLNAKLPLCVWQAGISSRREKLDGASASKLRYNSFWQLEYQCIYSEGTKADYRGTIIPHLQAFIGDFTNRMCFTMDSDRIPHYSESTIDIMLRDDKGFGREVASCSIRNDYLPNTKVCEFAIGLDRIVELSRKYT